MTRRRRAIICRQTVIRSSSRLKTVSIAVVGEVRGEVKKQKTKHFVLGLLWIRESGLRGGLTSASVLYLWVRRKNTCYCDPTCRWSTSSQGLVLSNWQPQAPPTLVSGSLSDARSLAYCCDHHRSEKPKEVFGLFGLIEGDLYDELEEKTPGFFTRRSHEDQSTHLYGFCFDTPHSIQI